MTDNLTIALAQLNPTVGDVAGNIAKLRAARAEAASRGADLVVATEMVVAGYPPDDLVLKPAFQDAVEVAVKAFAAETADGGPAIVLGAPWRGQGKLFNAALLLESGGIAFIRYKHELPNYGVFDEKRIFAAGPAPGPVVFKGVRIGLQVCEDMWLPDASETSRNRAPRSSSSSMPRPSRATRATSASISPSRASRRPACRFFT